MIGKFLAILMKYKISWTILSLDILCACLYIFYYNFSVLPVLYAIHNIAYTRPISNQNLQQVAEQIKNSLSFLSLES